MNIATVLRLLLNVGCRVGIVVPDKSVAIVLSIDVNSAKASGLEIRHICQTNEI